MMKIFDLFAEFIERHEKRITALASCVLLLEKRLEELEKSK